MSGLSLHWLKNVFRRPDLGVYLDSARLRSFYAASDDLVEQQFDAVVDQDLRALWPDGHGHENRWRW